MPKLILAASIAALLVVIGCAAPAPSASPSPSAPAVVPSPTPDGPSAEPSVVPSPDPTAEPSASPVLTPSSSPRPHKPTFNAAERYLQAGILRGAVECEPVRTDLPAGSIAGIECASDEPSVARIGYYLFGTEQDMLDAYVARVERAGLEIGSGADCAADGGESEYVPWEAGELAPYRNACFINDAGYANYRVTLPGANLYIGILGRSKDMAALADFAFRGSQDVPGFPTLWSAAE